MLTVLQLVHGVNTMGNLYEKLLDASKSLLVGDMLLDGVSDPAELANHAWMMIETGEIKLPEKEEVSYRAICLKVKVILSGGTATYRKDQNQSDFKKLKYGKFISWHGIEDYLADSAPFEPDSDLDEVYPILKCVLEENNREYIEGIQEFGGEVKSYYEDNPQLTITRQAFNNRVNKARKEFLAITPPDCDLYNTSRRLRRRYNIGEASVN